MVDTIKRYMCLRDAERFTAKRSLMAERRGECSQFEVRRHKMGAIVGGPAADLAVSPFKDAPIMAQWSAGYRV